MRSRFAVAAAAIATALATLVTACGGSDSSSQSSGSGQAQKKQDTTITLWTMPNSPDPKGDLQKLLQPFTQQTGIKVDVQVVGWDVQLDRIRNAAVSGSGPDVTQAGTTQVPFFAALGGFTDLSGKIGQVGGAGAYQPGIFNTTKVVGQDGNWAVPWFTEARAGCDPAAGPRQARRPPPPPVQGRE